MLLSEIPDQELVKNYLNGDNPSFEVLLKRHKSRVFAFIMSKIKNRDITEDKLEQNEELAELRADTSIEKQEMANENRLTLAKMKPKTNGSSR